MTEIVNSHPLGPTNEARILAFEKYIGYVLPPDYREFLFRYNGGQPSPDAFLLDVGFGEEELTVFCFFPMGELQTRSGVEGIDQLRFWPLYCAWDDFEDSWENIYEGQEKPEIPLLPIGTDGSSNYLCLILAGNQAGKVVFFEHETTEIIELAKDFTTFRDSLRPRIRLDYAKELGEGLV